MPVPPARQVALALVLVQGQLLSHGSSEANGYAGLEGADHAAADLATGDHLDVELEGAVGARCVRRAAIAPQPPPRRYLHCHGLAGHERQVRLGADLDDREVQSRRSTAVT